MLGSKAVAELIRHIEILFKNNQTTENLYTFRENNTFEHEANELTLQRGRGC